MNWKEYNNFIEKYIEKKGMQELMDCAFEQGFGKMAKERPGVILPSIPKNIFIRLVEIFEDNKKNKEAGENNG
jgi:hypothetical protein